VAIHDVSPGESISTNITAATANANPALADTVRLLAGTHSPATCPNINKNIIFELAAGAILNSPGGTTNSTAFGIRVTGSSTWCIIKGDGYNLDPRPTTVNEPVTNTQLLLDIDFDLPLVQTTPTCLIQGADNVYDGANPSASIGAGIMVESGARCDINGVRIQDCTYGIRGHTCDQLTATYCDFSHCGAAYEVERSATGGHEVGYCYFHEMDRMVVGDGDGGANPGEADHGGNAIQMLRQTRGLTQSHVHHNVAIGMRADSPDYGSDGGFIEFFAMGGTLVEHNYVEDAINFSETGTTVATHCDDVIIRYNKFAGRSGLNSLSNSNGTGSGAYGATSTEYQTDACTGIYYRDGLNWEIHNNEFDKMDGYTIVFESTTAPVSSYDGPIGDFNMHDNVIRTRGGANKYVAINNSIASYISSYGGTWSIGDNYVVIGAGNTVACSHNGSNYSMAQKASWTTATGASALGATDTWSIDEPPTPDLGGTFVAPPLLATVTAPTTNGQTNVISSPDFAPAAVLLWTTGQTANGTAAGAMMAFGAADASGGDFWIGSMSDDAVTTKNVGKYMREDSSIGVLTSGTPTLDGYAVVTMDASSVTLTWTDAPTAAVLVHAMVLSDLNGIIAVGAFDLPTGGSVPYTFDVTNAGVFGGETPDVVLLATSRIASASVPGGTAHGHLGFGAFDGTTTWGQTMWEGEVTPDGTNSALITTFSSVEPVRLMNDSATAGLDIRCDTPTFITNGFRLNIINIPAAATRCGYIAIKSDHVAVFSDTKPTSSTTKKTTLPFQPAAVLAITTGSGTDHAATTSVNTSGNGVGSMEISAAVDNNIGGSDYIAAGYYADDGIATSDTSRRFGTSDLMFMGNPPTPTTVGTATVDTWDVDGITLNWTSADATARYFGGLAFEAIEEDVPDYKLHLTALGVG
jgi:hypothetical protein